MGKQCLVPRQVARGSVRVRKTVELLGTLRLAAGLCEGCGYQKEICYVGSVYLYSQLPASLLQVSALPFEHSPFLPTGCLENVARPIS